MLCGRLKRRFGAPRGVWRRRLDGAGNAAEPADLPVGVTERQAQRAQAGRSGAGQRTDRLFLHAALATLQDVPVIAVQGGCGGRFQKECVTVFAKRDVRCAEKMLARGAVGEEVAAGDVFMYTQLSR